MKFIKSYILSIVALGSLSALTACNDHDTDEFAGKPSQGAFFAASQSSFVDIDKNASSFILPIERSTDEGALIVQLISDDPSGLFSVPGEAVFAEGEKMTSIVIGYDADQLVADQQYKISVRIADDAFLYGRNEITLTAVKAAPWSPWTLLPDPGTYTYTIIFSGDDVMPVYTRVNQEDPNIMQYCIGNIGMNGANGKPVPEAEQIGLFYGANLILTRDLTTNLVTVNPTNTMVYQSNYGEYIYVSDVATWSGNPNYAAYNEFDPETGLFTLWNIYYISLGSFGNGDEYFQLGGYADYSVEITRRGNYVEDGKEYATFFVLKSDDLDSFRYTLLPGEATYDEVEAAAEALAADEDAEQPTESSMIAFPFETEGVYTVVVLGYVGNEVKTIEAEAFELEFVSSTAASGQTVTAAAPVRGKVIKRTVPEKVVNTPFLPRR